MRLRKYILRDDITSSIKSQIESSKHRFKTLYLLYNLNTVLYHLTMRCEERKKCKFETDFDVQKLIFLKRKYKFSLAGTQSESRMIHSEWSKP